MSERYLSKQVIAGALVLFSLSTCAIAVHAVTGSVATPKSREFVTVCPHPVHDQLTVKRDSALEAKIEEHDERWDHCIALGGVPVPGYAAGARWGLVCLRPGAVIMIDETAW